MKTFIVDSFTDQAFKGNPAGVCVVDSDISDQLMLNITQELGFSETAFIKAIPNSHLWSIRYFTPKVEIALCGHATLAAAKVLFDIYKVEQVEFNNIQDIKLPVQLRSNKLIMKFPVYETVPSTAPPKLLSALGIDDIVNCEYNQESEILLIEIDSIDNLAVLTPDFIALYHSHDSINGVVVTAKSTDQYDFHSRYFWPWSGTEEDPVTGLTHTFLAKYWSEKLGKTSLSSFQNSSRTGFMHLEVSPTDVFIQGNAVVVFKGEFLV